METHSKHHRKDSLKSSSIGLLVFKERNGCVCSSDRTCGCCEHVNFPKIHLDDVGECLQLLEYMFDYILFSLFECYLHFRRHWNTVNTFRRQSYLLFEGGFWYVFIRNCFFLLKLFVYVIITSEECFRQSVYKMVRRRQSFADKNLFVYQHFETDNKTISCLQVFLPIKKRKIKKSEIFK